MNGTRSSMEDEESIIITIAEAEGWTECRSVIKGAGGWPRTPTAHGKPPNRKYEAECPRYTRDLNAMHHVEINMPIEKKRPYAMFLAQLLNTHPTIDLDDQFLNITATALQRAKAFIKVMNYEK